MKAAGGRGVMTGVCRDGVETWGQHGCGPYGKSGEVLRLIFGAKTHMKDVPLV